MSRTELHQKNSRKGLSSDSTLCPCSQEETVLSVTWASFKRVSQDFFISSISFAFSSSCSNDNMSHNIRRQSYERLANVSEHVPEEIILTCQTCRRSSSCASSRMRSASSSGILDAPPFPISACIEPVSNNHDTDHAF